MRLVEGEIRPADILTLEAVNGFGGQALTEDVSMPSPLKLGASFIAGGAGRRCGVNFSRDSFHSCDVLIGVHGEC